MRKKLFTTITLLLSFVGCIDAWAQNALVVETNDGQTYSYVLAEKPRLSFNATEMIISSVDADASFERTAIKNFRFEDVETGISSMPGNGQRMTYLDGILTVEGDGTVGIYDTAGRQILNNKVSEGHSVSVDMNAYPKGTYIIRCGKQTMKINHY